MGLQIGLGWSALAAGAAGVAITLTLALLSSRVGALIPRLGSRPLLVAPVTTTVLGDVPVAASGVGSGVNNAVARVAGPVAVAVIPLAAGLTGTSASSGTDVLPGFSRATLMCAALCLCGAALSWFGFTRETGKEANTA